MSSTTSSSDDSITYFFTLSGYGHQLQPDSASNNSNAFDAPRYLIRQDSISTADISLLEHDIDAGCEPVHASITAHSGSEADIQFCDPAYADIYAATCTSLLLISGEADESQQKQQQQRFSFALPAFDNCQCPLHWEQQQQASGVDDATDADTFKLVREDTGATIAWSSGERLTVSAYVGSHAIDQIVASQSALTLLRNYEAPPSFDDHLAHNDNDQDLVLDIKALCKQLSAEERAELLQMLLAAASTSGSSTTPSSAMTAATSPPPTEAEAEAIAEAVGATADCGSSEHSSLSSSPSSSSSSPLSSLEGGETPCKGSVVARLRKGSRDRYEHMVRSMKNAKEGVARDWSWQKANETLTEVADIVNAVGTIASAVNGNGSGN